MMFETEAVDQAIEPYINENVGTNDFVEATYDFEELNDFGVNIEFDEDDVSAERILGKVFDTPDDAYTFYNDYSILHCFGIRRDDTIKNPKKMSIFGRYMYATKMVSNRYTKMLQVKMRKNIIEMLEPDDEKWLVNSFNGTYNPYLTMTCTKVMKHRFHSNFYRSIECKSFMVQFGQARLKPSRIKKNVNTMNTSNVDDFYGHIKHFQDKTLVDIDQYFVVHLSDDRYPRNIFWANGRSRDAYTKFRDVVMFVVTYMTNKFKMHFPPFTGVNHHGQSIIFGGALLEKEKEETFECLFDHFLKCMFGKYPKAIITYQDNVHDILGSMKPRIFDHMFPVTMIFKRRTSNGTRLNEFVIQYDKAVLSQRAAEEDEDFKTMNSRLFLSSVYPIEAKECQFYTRKMFDIFKTEWTEAITNLTHETITITTEESTYRVGHRHMFVFYV
uniref:MULE transposase domain-containing protein n=1 Tax=Lactuca sativa TaxID=4236 RepID=A0A9R1UN80_LACSA|nr:hypothetical protein LSAT_V11C800446290 [Lactuca sativa]